MSKELARLEGLRRVLEAQIEGIGRLWQLPQDRQARLLACRLRKIQQETASTDKTSKSIQVCAAICQQVFAR